jgi:TRAP-type C4-dicarboxylate transport system substrate-binding protein
MNQGHRLSFALAGLLVAGSALADPVTLRMASIAPDGTAWAREVRAFQREIETGTHGAVSVKWYLGGIAGDEVRELERARAGQLDGIGGSSFCERLAPSMLVTHLVGLYRDRDEAAHVISSLRPTFEAEFRKAGFTSLATSVFGTEVLFSRQPVRTMAEFRAQRWWTWNASNFDQIWQMTMPELGAHAVPAALDQLQPIYQQRGVDGFVAVPSVALGFQWSPMATYFTDLTTALVPACLVLSSSALDALPLEQQQVVRTAGAKLNMRWNEVTASLDHALLNGLFEKQGLKKVPATRELRTEFFAAAKAARDKLGERLVPRALLAQVEKYLESYRATHPEQASR